MNRRSGVLTGEQELGSMIDGMDRGAAFAARLRVSSGLAGARAALDVARIGGIGRPPVVVKRQGLSAGQARAVRSRSQADVAERTGEADRAVTATDLPRVSGAPGINMAGRQQNFARAEFGGDAPKIKLTLMKSSAGPSVEGERSSGGGVVPSMGNRIAAPADPKDVMGIGAFRDAMRAGVDAGFQIGAATQFVAPGANVAKPIAARALPKQDVARGAGGRQVEAQAMRAAYFAARAVRNASAVIQPRAPTAAPSSIGSMVRHSTEQPIQGGEPSSSAAGGALPDAGSSTMPAANQQRSGAQVAGDVYLDGALMGRWMARNLATQAARPASGSASFDPRRGVFPTGAMIGG